MKSVIKNETQDSLNDLTMDVIAQLADMTDFKHEFDMLVEYVVKGLQTPLGIDFNDFKKEF